MKTIVGILVLGMTEIAWAATIHVPADQRTIQAGIHAAVDGDEIVLARGTYRGQGNINVDFNGKRITVRSATGPEDCIIDCEGLGRAFVFQTGEMHDSVLDGLTIINGSAPDGGTIETRLDPGGPVFYSLVGGAIKCDLASPSIRNCVFAGNQAEAGGAIAANSGYLHLLNCEFFRNQATSGGGVAIGYLQGVVNGCTFIENTAEDGGAMLVGTGAVTPIGGEIRNCHFSRNIASNYGGAIMTRQKYGAFKVVNCLLERNEAGNGAAIFSYTTPVIVEQSTVTANIGNSSDIFGPLSGLGFGGFGVRNSIVWGNLPSGHLFLSSFDFPTSHSVFEFDQPQVWGAGMIHADPQFVNPAAGNYRLKPTSPCVDAGLNAIVSSTLATDLDGYPRILDGSLRLDGVADVDMGCYERVRSRIQIATPPTP